MATTPDGNYYADLPDEVDGPGAPTNTGGGAPDSINYSGPPLLNPPDLASIVVDKDARQWQYPPPSGPWQ